MTGLVLGFLESAEIGIRGIQWNVKSWRFLFQLGGLLREWDAALRCVQACVVCFAMEKQPARTVPWRDRWPDRLAESTYPAPGPAPFTMPTRGQWGHPKSAKHHGNRLIPKKKTVCVKERGKARHGFSHKLINNLFSVGYWNHRETIHLLKVFHACQLRQVWRSS